MCDVALESAVGLHEEGFGRKGHAIETNLIADAVASLV